MPTTYLVAGISKPFLLENALRWTDALRVNGNDVFGKSVMQIKGQLITRRYDDHPAREN